MRLEGKVALVTGAGSGIGRAIAQLFVDEGATVIVNDVNAAGAEETVSSLSTPARGVVFRADVSSSTEVGSMFADVARRFDRLDVLVNNAGIAEVGPERGAEIAERAGAQMAEQMSGGPVRTQLDVLRKRSDDEWAKMLGVHLNGTFYCTRAAIPLFDKAGGGSVINMASIAGLMGMPIAPHYGAAKAGIIGFTRSIAHELAPRGIRANAICPGWIDTPMTQPVGNNPMIATLIKSRTPMHRYGEPREIATVALFLATNESSFMTGQWVSPNGGFFIG
jgi:3-oxoacyl-[acyl-carrier protein] reductase